jgi:hypothetical protein
MQQIAVDAVYKKVCEIYDRRAAPNLEQTNRGQAGSVRQGTSINPSLES